MIFLAVNAAASAGPDASDGPRVAVSAFTSLMYTRTVSDVRLSPFKLLSLALVDTDTDAPATAVAGAVAVAFAEEDNAPPPEPKSPPDVPRGKIPSPVAPGNPAWLPVSWEGDPDAPPLGGGQNAERPTTGWKPLAVVVAEEDDEG